jgi:hypothetical protein
MNIRDLLEHLILATHRGGAAFVAACVASSHL